jgi:hypothetical protein
MVGQAKNSRAGFVIVAAGALLRPGATAGPVEVVAHTVPLMLGSAAFHDRAAPDQAAAGASAASGTPAAAAALPLLMAARRLLHERRPLLQVLRPALLSFPEGQRGFLCHCSTRTLPQHAVDEVRDQPAKGPSLEFWTTLGYAAGSYIPDLKTITKKKLKLNNRRNCRVSDPDPDPYPDPDWIRIESDHWIRIRIRNLNTDPYPDLGGQNDPQK